MNWDELYKNCESCDKCGLSKTRKNVVVGTGNREADLMFIGEGPGEQEDLKGEPFVGAAGQLFTKMLNAIGFSRDEVYIANIIKCRPPSNRDPHDDEKTACIDFLNTQIELVSPKIIVCLGRVAACSLIDKNFKITAQRGQWFLKNGISYVATFHPSALLRDESKKQPAWTDFKNIKNELRNRIV